MTLKFEVTVNVERADMYVQSESDFRRNDGPAMRKYLTEKIKDAMEGSWQYNAKVTSCKVKNGKLNTIATINLK